MKPILIILGIIVLAAFLWIITRDSSYQPSLQSTYDGDPFAYDGNKTLVVAVYAPWASVWKVTESELAKLNLQRYDLRLVSADSERELARRLGTNIVPTVFVFRDGKTLQSFPNLMRIDELP